MYKCKQNSLVVISVGRPARFLGLEVFLAVLVHFLLTFYDISAGFVQFLLQFFRDSKHG